MNREIAASLLREYNEAADKLHAFMSDDERTAAKVDALWKITGRMVAILAADAGVASGGGIPDHMLDGGWR